jgi:hypothetical protein
MPGSPRKATMTRFRFDRIWRLGEKELKEPPKYWRARSIELNGALEDDEPTGLACERYGLGISAIQVTSLAWHEHWGRQ